MGNSSDNSCCADWEERTVSSDDSPRRSGQARQRSRLYIFCVTTLAVFLASLLFRPPTPIGYEWQATIRHSITGEAAIASQLLASDPTDEITNECCVIAAGDDDTAAEFCSIHVAFELDPADSNARTILVRHRHADKEEGRACLTRTIDRYITAHNRSDQQEDLAAKRDIAANLLRHWETRVTTVERELAEYVRFASKRTPGGATAEPNGVVGSAANSLQALPATVVANPRWESLSRQFHDADIRLRGLQERFTNEHPHVTEAQRVVSALERVLDATPQFVTANHEIPRTGPSTAQTPSTTNDDMVTNPAPTGQETVTEQPTDISQSATYLALQESLQQAIEKRRLAAEALRDIPASTTAVLESAMLDEPPTLRKAIRAPISRTFLLSQLLPAALLGLVVALPSARPTLSPTLCSSADVEESLELPVYGTLSTSSEPAPTVPAVHPFTNAIQRIVTVCEFAIGAAILSMIVCAIFVPGFANDLVQDPFSAVASVLQRLGIYR